MIPVIAYELAVSTAPRDGAEARYSCRITVQNMRQPIQLPVNSEAEFMAAAALLQTAGQLFYVQQDGTLLKRMG